MAQSESTVRALDFSRANRQTWLARLVELLRFPTISSLYPANQAEFAACADWLVKVMIGMGFSRAG